MGTLIEAFLILGAFLIRNPQHATALIATWSLIVDTRSQNRISAIGFAFVYFPAAYSR